MKSQEISMRNASVFAQYVFVQRIDHIITALAKPCVLLSSCVFKDAQTVKSFWAHGLWRPECQANSAAIISSSFCLFFSLFLDEKVDFKVKEAFWIIIQPSTSAFVGVPAVLFLLFERSHQVCFPISRVLHTQGWRYTKRSDLSDADGRMSFPLLPKCQRLEFFFPSLLVVCFCERPWQVAATLLEPLASGLTCALCFWTALWPLLQTKKPFHTLI